MKNDGLYADGCVWINSNMSESRKYCTLAEEIGHYFPEIFHESAHCRYGNCTHRHEPGCAVLQAVEEQRISQSRYASYLSMLDDKEEGKYREGH